MPLDQQCTYKNYVYPFEKVHDSAIHTLAREVTQTTQFIFSMS
jgi:hypothetical protein